MGIPTTPEEEAAVRARGQMERPQIYTDPLLKQTVIRPSPWSSISGQQAPMQQGVGGATMAQRGEFPAYQDIPATPMQPQMLTIDDLGQFQDQTPAGGYAPQDVVSSEVQTTYQASPELGARGKVMEEEFKKDASLAQVKADIQFKKEQMKSEKGRDRVTGTINKTMSDLEKINDKLKAKEAIINNDASMLQNLKNKYGTSWLGRETGSVTRPEIESLRKEYEVKRDSLIPAYIAYNELPATVVDTEEFQQRILQSFGDPSLSYEANQAALDNMKGQFGLIEQAVEEKPMSTEARRKRLEELRAKAGR